MVVQDLVKAQMTIEGTRDVTSN